MKSKRLGVSALPFLAALMVVACEPSEPPKIAMPEVNDKNCELEKIKALPESIRKEFGDLCFFRGTYKPSAPSKW